MVLFVSLVGQWNNFMRRRCDAGPRSCDAYQVDPRVDPQVNARIEA
jgi:hypothetical protein